jgi:hypothetical protein
MEQEVYLLRLVLHTAPPDPGILELVQDLFVDSVTEVFDGGAGGVEDHRRAVVWDLSLGFGVNADHVSRLPHSLQELFKVPSVAESR